MLQIFFSFLKGDLHLYKSSFAHANLFYACNLSFTNLPCACNSFSYHYLHMFTDMRTQTLLQKMLLLTRNQLNKALNDILTVLV